MRMPRIIPFCLIAAFGAAHAQDLDYTIDLTVAHQEFDGTFNWFHPRCAAIPREGQPPLVVMTMQKWFLTASDYFSGLSVITTDDLGTTWTTPDERPELAWRDEPNETTVGICDVTPTWHAPTGKLLAAGHTVRYRDGHLMSEPRPRETGYSYFDPKTGEWADWKMLNMGGGDAYFSAGSGCAQRLNEPDGTVLVPIYFKAKTDDSRATTSAQVLRCEFDGETLRVLEKGNAMTVPEPRGLGEPSVTYHDGRYFLTIRNDETGYVTSGEDGLHFDEPKPWTFDDGENLGSYNTQQHWATHSDGLFLVYTRRGANNDHIMRHRAPLFIARVDPERLVVLRDTERVVVPERGARLGNFGVSAITEHETWVTVGEGMWKHSTESGADGSVFVAKIRWNKPNRLIERLR